MKIVIDIPDGGPPSRHRGRVAHCLHRVAEFFEARPVDDELSGALTLGPGLGIISWAIKGVQQ